MTLRSRLAIISAIAFGAAAFIALRLSRSYNAPIAPGHGDDGELLAFECDANAIAPGDITVHFDTLKEKISARCSCASLAGVMHALEDCCNNHPAAKETACDDRTSFEINCLGSEGGGLAFSGPGNPTMRIGFFGGFTRSNWSCVSDGASNPDLDEMRKVFRNCCSR